MKKEWIYFGIFLNEETKEKLKEDLIKKGINLNEWKLICHHMTIAFNDGSKEVQEEFEKYKNLFGKEYALYPLQIGFSKDAIALKVSFNSKTFNNFPHITLAVPKKGGNPVNSNYITKWYDYTPRFWLKGKLDYFKPNK